MKIKTTKEKFEDYKVFVVKKFKAEGPKHDSLLRAGLELSEEMMEFIEEVFDLDAPLEGAILELGDIAFWFAWLSHNFNYEWQDGLVEKEGSRLYLLPTVKTIVGNIKRYFRDGNEAKLEEIGTKNLMELQIALSEQAKSLGKSLEEVIEFNKEKLNKRHG